MKRLSALLLLTLAAGCATPPVQVVPARCPQLPEAPQILREPPPTAAVPARLGEGSADEACAVLTERYLLWQHFYEGVRAQAAGDE